MIQFEDFEKVDIRVGKIIEAELIPGAQYSTHKLKIDFGDQIGTKKSCARLIHYDPADLIGQQVLAVVNFPARQIGKNMSEVLTLGVPDGEGECALIQPGKNVPLGGKLF